MPNGNGEYPPFTSWTDGFGEPVLEIASEEGCFSASVQTALGSFKDSILYTDHMGRIASLDELKAEEVDFLSSKY